jgi:fatty acid desaturase
MLSRDGPLEQGRPMIGFGIFLLILAVLFPELAVLWGIGILCIVIGLILFVLGTIGHAVGGRRHYY